MPAAISTASVPAVPGSPRHKHTAVRCIMDSVLVYLLLCHGDIQAE